MLLPPFGILKCYFCNYSGSQFTVGYFAFFIFFEIVDEPTNGNTCSSGLLVDIFEFVGQYVLFIQCNIEFALDFRARPLGISQEPDKLCICLGIETLGICIDDPAAS